MSHASKRDAFFTAIDLPQCAKFHNADTARNSRFEEQW